MRLKLHREGREEKRENVEAAPSWRHKLQNLILTFAKLFFPSTTGINFTIVLSQILKCYLLKKCQTSVLKELFWALIVPKSQLMSMMIVALGFQAAHI